MKETDLRVHIDNLFFEAQATLPPPAHICWFDNDLRILPTHHTKKKHPVFMTLNHTKLSEGLTTSQWESLANKLIKFFKERL